MHTFTQHNSSAEANILILFCLEISCQHVLNTCGFLFLTVKGNMQQVMLGNNLCSFKQAILEAVGAPGKKFTGGPSSCHSSPLCYQADCLLSVNTVTTNFYVHSAC